MSTKVKRSPVMWNNSFIKYEPTDAQSNGHYKKKGDSPSLADIRNRIRSILELMKKPGVLTPVHLFAAGFKYTGDGDKARCDECGLESSNWTLDMNPFDIHSKLKPDCPFIRSIRTSSLSNISSSSTTVIRNRTSDKQENPSKRQKLEKTNSDHSSTIVIRNTISDEQENPSKRQKLEKTNSDHSSTIVIRNTISDKQENPSKRQKLEKTNSDHSSTTLPETDLVLQVRRRTFSHWPHRTIPSSAQMIEAGFFNCNVGDRVICIYCNLICQLWTPHIDDPCEIHKTLSPDCPYVKAKLIRPSASSIIIVNESSTIVATTNHLPTSENFDPLRFNEIVSTAACNPAYAKLSKRRASFATWPRENLPPVDDLVRAGFFYTGMKTIVTCFYCHGSIQNWKPNDNPMIKHARWFPRCGYAKQLCGDEMYRKIQISKRAQQERGRASDLSDKTGSGVMSNTNVTTNSRQLLIPDENTLSTLVAARLNLPMSQKLLDQNFELRIIKRCWEDHLRLKQDDFVSECDLFIAYLILQKQMEHIDGKKENLTIPSEAMRQLRERNLKEQKEVLVQIRAARESISHNAIRSSCANAPNGNVLGMRTLSQSSVESTSKLATTGTQGETKTTKQTPPATQDQEQSNNATPSNPCILCLTEEKRLACIPCGHLATCVPCGHSLRSCPICREAIEAFVRIYI